MKTILSFAVFALFASAQAQVIYHDGFEEDLPDALLDSVPGVPTMGNARGWETGQWGQVSYQPRVRASGFMGMPAFAGKQMLEVQPGASAGSGFELYNLGFNTNRTYYPVVEFSLRFHVTQTKYAQKIQMRPGMSGDNYYFNINTKTGAYYLSHITQDFGNNGPILAGWNTMKVRIDLTKRVATGFLNGVQVAQVPAFDPRSGVYAITNPLEISQIDESRPEYSDTTGGPSILLDEYWVVAVPEPSAWVILGAGLCFVRLRQGARR
jgi:hypothetical protein